MLQVNIEGKNTPMMIDTGATYTCISSNHASHLTMSGKFTETVGSGQTQLIPITAWGMYLTGMSNLIRVSTDRRRCRGRPQPCVPR
ncbi:MAG: retroviral-like aspartic protease family protein [Plesiomonas shigelloides]